MRHILRNMLGRRTLRSWAAAELAPWRGGVDAGRVDQIAALHPSIFLLEVGGGDVQIGSKPGVYERGQPPGQSDHELIRRAEAYRDFLHKVVQIHGIAQRIRLALDVDDLSTGRDGAPVFSFQKRRGDTVVLLPDIDFVLSKHYRAARVWSVPDPNGYAAKANAAIFAGSTTGAGAITMQALRDNSVPRIRAARFFKTIDGVDFHLPNIVQCADDEVVAALQQEGFGSGRLSWADQLRYKFVVTLDGNGATCSRIYLALASNSVPIKYASDHDLFYFRGLVSGRHYLPVTEDRQVVEIVAAERARPGRFATVAAEGRRFAERYLTNAMLHRYAAELLTQYAALQRPRA